MGEENIIDSIPLAEADLVTVSEEDGSHSVQYGKSHDTITSLKSNRSLEKMESFQPHPESSEVSSMRPQIFGAGLKRIHSSKIFNHPSRVAQGKSEEDPAKKKRSVLQISTIAEGFNSGPFHHSS